MGTEQRDRVRMRAWGQVLSELGLPSTALDKLKPVERSAAVREAIAARAEEMRRPESERAAGAGEVVTLGGEQVVIRPLPRRAAMEWRKIWTGLQIKHREWWKAATGRKDEEALALAMLELDERIGATNEEALKAYGVEIPEAATEAEIAAAMEVAVSLTLPLFGGMSQTLVAAAERMTAPASGR